VTWLPTLFERIRSLYTPRVRRFENAEINIRDDTGKPEPFERGK